MASKSKSKKSNELVTDLGDVPEVSKGAASESDTQFEAGRIHFKILEYVGGKQAEADDDESLVPTTAIDRAMRCQTIGYLTDLLQAGLLGTNDAGNGVYLTKSGAKALKSGSKRFKTAA